MNEVQSTVPTADLFPRKLILRPLHFFSVLILPDKDGSSRAHWPAFLMKQYSVMTCALDARC